MVIHVIVGALVVALVSILIGARGRELRVLYALIAPLWGHRVFLQTLLRVSRTREGGIAPLVRLRLWPLAARPLLLVNDMALARAIVQDGELFHTMGLDNPATVALLGPQGLFTTRGTSTPEWQRRRRVTDPLLSSDPAFTERIFADLLATARAYVGAWEGEGGPPRRLLRELARVMIPAQSVALFGDLFSPAANRQAGEDLLANFQQVGEGLFFRPTVWLRRPWTRIRLGRSWAYIDKITAVIVADARRSGAARPPYGEQAGGEADPRPGFFRLLADALRSGDFDVDEVRDTVALFMNAGAPIHHAFWTLHTLAHHPEVEAEVVAELREVLARGPLDFRRLRELGALRRVLLEVMRLYPPVPLFQPRRAVRDAQLGDLTLRAGTQLLISPYIIHRSPALGVDVEAFRPEREGNGLASAQMFPFSVGARTCQGRNFAMLAVTAILVAILERYAVRLRAHQACPRPSEAVYCRPSRDLIFTVSARAGVDAGAEAELRA